MVDQTHEQTPCLRRTPGDHRAAASGRITQAQGRATARPGPRGADGDQLRAQEWDPVGATAPRDGLRLGGDLLAALA